MGEFKEANLFREDRVDDDMAMVISKIFMGVRL